MLLPPPSAPSSAHRFSPLPGLRSLLVAAPDATTPGVVTRAAAAAVASRSTATPCRRSGEDVVVQASGVGGTIGHCDQEEEEVNWGAKEEEEAGISAEEEDEELDGFWVSYGRRRPRRRLPPLIPSLVARGALRRTRTADGRLIIRIVPVVRPECIRARRDRGGSDRLTMQLVERQDDGSPMMAPPLREPAGSSARLDDDNVIRIAQQGDEDTATVEEAVAAPEPETTTIVPAVPPPRVSSVGCFEDVFRFDPIVGNRSLRQMPSLIRMVH
ncbi:unnamed protein product [Urochloa humidicola]